jgi:Zn-dependent peptidase ImmA (M78 family)/transcriptional regulator with XRE-family HTH domain
LRLGSLVLDAIAKLTPATTETMPTRNEALITPEVLRWAVTESGREPSWIARRLNISAQRLSDWIDGASRPTVRQARLLADVLKRPFELFYLPGPPLAAQELHDFRRLPGQIAGRPSPELRLEVRKAHFRCDIARELFGEAEGVPELQLPTISQQDDAEAASAALLGALGAGMASRPRFGTDRAAFAWWRERAEQVGILVFQMRGVDLDEARAFSIGAPDLPVAVVNNRDSAHGKAFSLLHEATHIALRRAGLCDLDDHEARRPEDLRIEVFCNRVAGACLVPSAALTALPAVARATASSEWTDEDLRAIAARFGASREVVLRRLLILERTSQAFYQRKRDQWLQEYSRRATRRAGPVPPHFVALGSNGPRLTRLVLESVARERVSLHDAANYLELRVAHFPKLEAALSRAEA